MTPIHALSIADVRELLRITEARLEDYPVQHPQYVRISEQIVRLRSSISYMEESQCGKK